MRLYTWIMLVDCLFVILTEDELYGAELDLLWLLYWSLVEWLWLLH